MLDPALTLAAEADDELAVLGGRAAKVGNAAKGAAPAPAPVAPKVAPKEEEGRKAEPSEGAVAAGEGAAAAEANVELDEPPVGSNIA